MGQVELSAGAIEYQDTGGDGPVVVLLHGLLMDSSLWRRVVPELSPDYRCVTPTLPLGGHRLPMRPGADLSLLGQVRLLAEFLDRLELAEVTVAGSDWGGAQLLVSEGLARRVSRLVLISCEAFDNYPPGLPGRAVVLAAALPGGLYLAMQQLRLPFFLRSPLAFGWMAKHGISAEVTRRWFAPAQTSKAIRRDLRRYLRPAPKKADLRAWAQQQRTFTGAVLVVWAPEDRVMPREHGRRLAEWFPNGRLVEIADSYALIPEDQPAMLAAVIRDFLIETADAKP
jgi:pimeloyl-ACP methyl ester carboxylesterase